MNEMWDCFRRLSLTRRGLVAAAITSVVSGGYTRTADASPCKIYLAHIYINVMQFLEIYLPQ
jgi:hypothetical protein